MNLELLFLAWSLLEIEKYEELDEELDDSWEDFSFVFSSWCSAEDEEKRGSEWIVVF